MTTARFQFYLQGVPLRHLLIAIATIGAFAICVLLFRHASSRATEMTCGNNLKQLGLGLQNYHDTYNRFPSPNESGHSWRIRVLPFCMATPLADAYRFDLKWDDPANLSIDTRGFPSKSPTDSSLHVHGPPFGFACPSDDSLRGTATYLMIVGEHAFGKPASYRSPSEITDGFQSTIVIAESFSKKVHWLEPTDLRLESMSLKINDPTPPSISSSHPSGPAVLFADGEVFRLSPGLPSEILHAMLTIDGGETIDRDSLVADGLLVHH